MRENLKNLLSQLAKIESALLEKSSKGLGEVARYDMQKLHVLIAEKLGWSVEDTHKFSLQMLREMVKDKSPKLAHEISNALRSGDHLYGKPLRGRR